MDIEDEYDQEHFFLTKPTLIANGKFLVYAGSRIEDGHADEDEIKNGNGYGLHIYDLENRCTIAKIAKAEVLIDSFEDADEDE